LSKYSEEQITKIRAWAKDGLSSSEIAQRLGGGRSRNAVIGLCSRNGIILGRLPTQRPPTKVRAIPAKQATPKLPKLAPAPSSINPQRIADFKPPTIIPDREGAGPTCSELETGMCRAPVGKAGGADQQHCGAQTKATPRGSRSGIGGFETYCEPCAKRLNKPVPSRAR